MPVTDEQAGALRAYLTDDPDEHKRLYGQLDRAAARAGYVALLTAAFVTAVTRRFGQPGAADDVIDFVADLRSRSDAVAGAIDPRAAEHLIQAALNDDDTGVDAKNMGGLMVVILAGLVADEELTADGLDEFLAEARKVADEWLR
jgi:hypothetical protein